MDKIRCIRFTALSIDTYDLLLLGFNVFVPFQRHELLLQYQNDEHHLTAAVVGRQTLFNVIINFTMECVMGSATTFIRGKINHIFLIVCALIIASGTLSAANLHLFLVGDYDSSELMPALKYDIANIRREARDISTNTGLKVIETVLVAAEARTANVLSKLKALKVSKNDVIFFYFTGHGFRMASKGDNPWPYLFFAKEYKGIDFTLVYDILTSKQARFNLLIVDGCNNVLKDYSVPIVKGVVHAASQAKLVRDNYQKLFLDYEGTISIAACQPGQTSLALTNGSLFTLSFLKCLHRAVKGSGGLIDWQSLLDQSTNATITTAEEINEEQNPIFLIEP